MKQRIDLEMLAELTEEQKERLREWWKPEVGDFLYSDIYKQHGVIYCIDTYNDEARTLYIRWWNGSQSDIDVSGDFAPLLSIGQCLELLEPYSGLMEKGRDWGVEIDSNLRLPPKFKRYQDKELIHALWSAVKSVL